MTGPCPCGNGESLAACCGPILDGAPAPTAEALMRSRYTAYTTGNVEHVVVTHDPATRDKVDRDGIAAWSSQSKWLGLEVLATEGGDVPPHGSLVAWAQRVVLLLNAVLTVRAGEPNSHQGRGWELFTDAVIRRVAAKRTRVVFALWGTYAQKKTPLIDTRRHAVVTAAHPSPLSAGRGFLGSRPFSRINAALTEGGREPIDWRLD